jgi:hypothetical protein
MRAEKWEIRPGDAACYKKVAFPIGTEVISITELDKVSRSSHPVPLSKLPGQFSL